MTNLSPDQEMWEAVVRRALEDISAPFIAEERGNVTQRDWDEAVHFLTDTRGVWAQQRLQICDMAGLDEPVIRREALRIVRERVGAAAA